MVILRGTIWVGFALLISLSQSAYADLDTAINRAILKATENDTSRTDREKLFEHRCETIARYIGFADDPAGRARKYSCDVPGVGIAFYAGSDLGKHPPKKIAQLFKDRLANNDVQSEFYIKMDHEFGSSMAFYINGESWLLKPIDPLSAVDKIETLAAETNLILLKRHRIDSWMTKPVTDQ